MKFIKNLIKKRLRSPAEAWMYHILNQEKFCIISNDCYGGEIYRLTKRPYNTPFIGLMLMAPCYLKLLQNLEYYMQTTLKFADKSRYEAMNLFREKSNFYPLGLLDDIEIHFIHYANVEMARDNWERRRARMDFENLKIKFSLGKDYATTEHLQFFEALPFKNKLCIGPYQNLQSPHYVAVNPLDENAIAAFRQSVANVNFVNWLQGKMPLSHNRLNIIFYRAIRWLLRF